MNERHKKLVSMMERKQRLIGEVPERREKFCQEIGVLDDRISAEEMELLEKRQAMEEPLKERRKTEVEEWRDTVVAEGGVIQKAAAGSRSFQSGG